MQNNLLIETGKVVSVEKDCLWVETIQKSSCNACSARSGCGQSVLASLVEKSSYLRVLLDGRDPEQFHHGSIVKIGIPANSVAKGALMVYLTPMIGMLMGAVMGKVFFGNDLLITLCGGVGFLLGGTLVYLFNQKIKHDKAYQPVLVDDVHRDCIQVSQ